MDIPIRSFIVKLTGVASVLLSKQSNSDSPKLLCDGCNVRDDFEHRCHKNEALFMDEHLVHEVYVAHPEAKLNQIPSGEGGQTIICANNNWLEKIEIRQTCQCYCNDPDDERERRNFELAGRPAAWEFKKN